MITKQEFVKYCLEVRKIRGETPKCHTVDWLLRYCNIRSNAPLLYLFHSIGLRNKPDLYKSEFKYPDLKEINFGDLPDEVDLSYQQILEKL